MLDIGFQYNILSFFKDGDILCCNCIIKQFWNL